MEKINENLYEFTQGDNNSGYVSLDNFRLLTLNSNSSLDKLLLFKSFNFTGVEIENIEDITIDFSNVFEGLKNINHLSFDEYVINSAVIENQILQMPLTSLIFEKCKPPSNFPSLDNFKLVNLRINDLHTNYKWQGLTSLKTLYIENLSVESSKQLENLINLENLTIHRNFCLDLNFLKNLKKLKKLTLLALNKDTDIDAIFESKNLEELEVQSGYHSEWSKLAKLSNLEVIRLLVCKDNSFKSLLPKLKYLGVKVYL